MSEEFGKTAQQMAFENAALQKKLEIERKTAFVSYHIEAHDFDGSVKGKLNELNIPAGVIPMGFDVIIQDMDIPGVQHREYWLDSKEPIQSEWIDNEHTKFVAVIEGRLKRFKIITRVYCMTSKAASVSVPEVPVKSRSSGVQEIKDILNAVVDSKDHSEVIRLIESVKEKLYLGEYKEKVQHE